MTSPAFLALSLLLSTPTFLSVGSSPCLQGPFHRITRTADTGEILGPADPNDWGCLGGGTRARARIGVEDVPVPPPTDVCLEPAYPNPAPTRTTLQYALPAITTVKLVI